MLVVRVSFSPKFPPKYFVLSHIHNVRVFTCEISHLQATQYDNADRYALATLTISRLGTSLHDLQFLHNHYYAAILENVPVHSVLITVITNKPRDKVSASDPKIIILT